MSKKYIRNRSGGGIEITVFLNTPSDIGERIEIDESELQGKNADKCRINSQGKVYEDQTIITNQELNEQLKGTVRTKFKALGFTDEQIQVLVK